MKADYKITLANSQGFSDFMTLNPRHLLLYKVSLEQRKSHFAILNISTKKILRSFSIPLTFQAIYPITAAQNSQRNLPICFFVSSQRRIFRISNLASIPTVELVNFDSIQDEESTDESVVATAAPVESRLKPVKKPILIMSTSSQQLVVAFKGGSHVYRVDSQGKVVSRIHIGTSAENPKIDSLVQIPNDRQKVLAVLSNCTFALIDLVSISTTIQIMRIPTLQLRDSIAISSYSDNLYCLAQGESVSLVDFSRSQVVSSVQVSMSSNGNNLKTTSAGSELQVELQKQQLVTSSAAERVEYLFKNLIRIGESSFMGQYSMRSLGDSRIYFIDFKKSEIQSRYSDPNVVFRSISTKQNQEQFVMINPSYSSKALQIAIYSSKN